MNIRTYVAAAATAAMAGGLLLTGTTAASAANWDCASGAVCGFRYGSTSHNWQQWANATNLGWSNKVRNHGTPQYLDHVKVSYRWQEHGDPTWYHASKCVSPGKKKYLLGSHKEAYVSKVKWVHSC